MPRPLPLLIRLWFALDTALALLPPIHWAASGPAVLEVPRVLVYLFGTSAFVAASVVAAYLWSPSTTRAEG